MKNKQIKILFICYHKGTYPFLDNLSEQLIIRNYDIFIYDIYENYILDFKKNSYKKIFLNNFRYLYHIPILGKFLKNFLQKMYISNNIVGKFDLVEFHYLRNDYESILKILINKNQRTSIVLWGSDLFRESNANFNSFQRQLLMCKNIIVFNPEMLNILTEKFKIKLNKIKLLRFGNTNFKNDNIIGSNIFEIREKYGIDYKKIVISIGYNGNPEQNHSFMINEINKLDLKIKNNLFLILPMTYGGSKNYINTIRNHLSITNIKFIILDRFLEKNILWDTKMITNILFNAQITDSLSASIQEGFYCNSIMLLPDWLPYKIFSENGLFFLKYNKSNISRILPFIFENFSNLITKSKSNKDLILEFSSWNNCILLWDKNYNSILHD